MCWFLDLIFVQSWVSVKALSRLWVKLLEPSDAHTWLCYSSLHAYEVAKWPHPILLPPPHTHIHNILLHMCSLGEGWLLLPEFIWVSSYLHVVMALSLRPEAPPFKMFQLLVVMVGVWPVTRTKFHLLRPNPAVVRHSTLTMVWMYTVVVIVKSLSDIMLSYQLVSSCVTSCIRHRCMNPKNCLMYGTPDPLPC